MIAAQDQVPVEVLLFFLMWIPFLVFLVARNSEPPPEDGLCSCGYYGPKSPCPRCRRVIPK